MKKIFFILVLILLANCSIAETKYSSVLDKIENSIYGFTYTTADDESRLTRIEESVYGQSKGGKSVAERVSALQKDMSADLIGQEIAPKEDTFADEDDYSTEESIAQAPSGSNVDYPSDLNSRLAELEKKTLGKTFENDAFSSRVDRLQAEIKPKSFMDNNIAQSSNDYYDDTIVPLDKNYKLDGYKPPEFDYDSYNSQPKSPQKVNIASVEKSLYKKVFNNDSIENRISRLESTMFGTTFAQDTQQERINRISGAYKAQKTASKYDSNKFSQNMATAMQIGTILLMILACVL